MASPQPPPPAAPVPTTIGALDDDLLREIFLRLPCVTSLSRAAFACRAFLRAIRSSPAFRRRFRELHAPPLLALFLTPSMRAVVPASPGRCSSVSDPDADAFVDLLQDDDDDGSEWWTYPEIPYCEGYVELVNRSYKQTGCYIPHSQSLKIHFREPYGRGDTYLEFHTLSSPHGEPEQRPSRVVCVLHEGSWAWARVAVFSSRTMEWQVFPKVGPPLLDGYGNTAGMVVNGFVCWVHTGKGCILALDTATFQFSRMYLPPPLNVESFSRFKLGQTKDGKLCIVGVQGFELCVWLLTADDDGVQRFMLHKVFPLQASVNKVTDSEENEYAMQLQAELTAVVDGFVYLSVGNCSDLYSPQWFLTFCLETAEVNLLAKRSHRLPCPFDPYIMIGWPSSLIHNKQESESGVTGENYEDDGAISMCTEEASPVLVTALQSFREALIDDDNSSFAEIDDFLLDNEDNSLLNIIVNLESRIATLRHRALRIGSCSVDREGMERGSWWPMWKGRLRRACSQFLLLILAFSLVKMMSFLLKHAASEG